MDSNMTFRIDSEVKAQMAAMRSAVFVVTQALTPIQTYAWKQKDFPRKIIRP